METELPVAPFEPQRIYDAPELLFSQVLDEEFTRRGAVRTVFQPSDLSPAQRDGFSARLKRSLGNSGVGNALVDIATNPFVWMLFVTSPVGTTALARGGAGLFRSAPKFSAYLGDNAPFLQSMGVMTPLQSLRGSAAGATLNRVVSGISKMSDEEAEIIGKPLRELLERHKLRSLDIDDRRHIDAQREIVKRIAYALQGSLEGWDADTVRSVITKDTIVKNGVTVPKIVQRKAPRLIQENLDDELQRLGASDFRDAVRDALGQRLRRLYGKDDEASFVVDPDKVLRIYNGLKNRLFSGKVGKNDIGAESIRSILSDEVVEGIGKGDISLEAFREVVGEFFSAQIGTKYFPRNLLERVGQDGRTITPPVVAAMRRARRALNPSASAVGRSRSAGMYHPDDLEDITNYYTPTDELTKQIAKGRARQGRMAAKDEEALFYRINPERGLHLHFSDTARTYAWHVQDVGDEVRAVQREAKETVGGKLKVVDEKEFGTGFAGAKGEIPYTQTFDEATDAPLGGWSPAHALWREFTLMPGEYARHVVSHFAVPAVSGMYSTPRLATEMAVINAKQGLRSMLDLGLREAVRKVPKWGEPLAKRLDDFTDPAFAMEDAQASSRWLTKWLYVSHLGLNIPSVMLNLTQPLLLASSAVGPKAVREGYADAVREIIEYGAARARQGFKPLTPLAKREMIRKHFSFADREGEDLLGIAPNIFEAIEGVTFTGLRPFEQPGVADNIFEFMMKAFEKSEWLNRNVTAHAMKRAYEAKGLSTASPLFVRDVREGVLESQFGGQLLNTPLAFVSSDPKLTPFGRLLNNPLMRQFLTFQLRSVTGSLAVLPRVGAGTRVLFGKEVSSPALVLANDVLRGMGLSAVVYEVAKNLAGVDLSRAMYASATTDIFGGSRFLEGESPVPIPPALDIPINLVRGFATQDMELLGRTLPRTVPGGIALSRALGVAPRTSLPGLRSLQATYADWSNIENGLVPLFRGSDGAFIGYQPHTTLVLRGIGADMGRFRDQGELDGFLIANRERIVQDRQKMVDALLSGHIDRAKAIQRRFEREFGFPLQIDQKRLERGLRLRQTGRTERILDSFPREARGIYQEIVAERAGLTGAPASELVGQPTASRRSGRLSPFDSPDLSSILNEIDG